MATMPELVEVEALEAFTITRPYGQFHGDPASKRNRICKVPADAVGDLLCRQKIKPGKAMLSQLDHDGDGEPGGSTAAAGDDLTELRKAYTGKLGKNPFPGWGAEELLRRMAAAEGEPAGDDAPPP